MKLLSTHANDEIKHKKFLYTKLISKIMRKKVTSYFIIILLILPIIITINLAKSTTLPVDQTSSSSIIIMNENDVIIKGMRVVGNITVINSHNVIIYNNSIFASEYYGIFIYNSSNVKIVGNKIASNYYDGISVKQSNNVIIERNVITNNTNGDGITVWYFSNNITISNNTIINNKYGVFLLTSSNILVKNNSIVNSMYYGIYLYNVSNISLFDNLVDKNDVGLEIAYSSIVNILSNYISTNLVDVYLGKGIYNLTLKYNTIQSAKFVGLLIIYYPITFISQGNTFYNNTKNQFYAFNTTTYSITQSYINVSISEQERSGGQNPYLLPIGIIAVSFFLLLSLMRKRKKG